MEALNRAFTLALNGNLAELRPLMIDRQVAVDVVRPDGLFKGYTLLHAAASKAHVEVVEFLLSAGASPDVLNAQGKTALALARDKNHLAIVEILERASSPSAIPPYAVPPPTVAEKVAVARRARVVLDAAVAEHRAAEQSLANALIAEGTAPACDVDAAKATRVAAEQSLARALTAKEAASKMFGEATVRVSDGDGDGDWGGATPGEHGINPLGRPLPPEWQQPQTLNLQLAAVEPGSAEWVRLESRLRATVPSATLRRVERIQNVRLWTSFDIQMTMLQNDLGGERPMVQELFHGTGSTPPHEIYSGQEGFDMRFCNQGMWGIASYFAVEAGYSDQYCSKNGRGERELLVADVITGRTIELPPDASLRMPPQMPSTTWARPTPGIESGAAASMPSGTRYDSVTGVGGGGGRSRIYMIYRHDRAYPKFRLTYVHTDHAIVPEGVTTLEAGYFRGQRDLRSVALPASLTRIGDRAFEGFHSLALGELPASLTSIGDYAFFGCYSLALRELPASLTSIGGHAFHGCSSLALRELPASLTSIGDGTFAGCSSLALRELPASLTSIADKAFSGCSSLALRELPASLTSIGGYAFEGCSSLALRELPASLTSIGAHAFAECSSLALRELSASLTSIGVHPVNDEGALVALGTDEYAFIGHDGRLKFYCGRHLGTDAIPGSDGRCGPTGGPACASCSRFQTRLVNDEGDIIAFGTPIGCQGTFYCGKHKGPIAIPDSDGRCGPNDGPACQSCSRLLQAFTNRLVPPYCYIIMPGMPPSYCPLAAGPFGCPPPLWAGLFGPPGCIASPLPALFGAHTGSPGISFLTDALGSPEEACALIALLGGSPDEQPCIRHDELLDATACSALVRTLDEHAAACPPAEALDIRLSLTDEALESLIGMAQLERLRTAFGSPYDTIKLRRVAATNQCVPFHCDYSKRTMQVALNAEHEYGGGKLTFATAHGFVQPARPRGSATTHVNSLVHGVSTLTHGVRYGLFLCDTKGLSLDLHYLIDASRAQFAFFEQALDLLDSASDTELLRVVREYAALLEKGAGEGAPTSFAVELAWRTHLLHPVCYVNACMVHHAQPVAHQPVYEFPDAPCAAATGSEGTQAVTAVEGCLEWLGLDLVAGMRRQQSFMRGILADRAAFDSAAAIAAAVDEYHAFLDHFHHSAEELVPTPIVDLVWHTHMLDPRRYGCETRRLAGHFVNHEDDVAPERLGDLG
eukprot:jgi/Chrpa1/11096/Chrysochromulina_OHIO_Genome00022610-RA